MHNSSLLGGLLLTLAAGTLPAVTLTSAAADDAAVAAASISLHAESSTVAMGNKVRLAGSAKGVGRDAKVTIWQMTAGTGRWNIEGTARSKAGGEYTYSEVVHRESRVYKACVAAKTRQQICSQQRLVRVIKPRNYDVVAKTTSRTYLAGQQVVVNGTVRPKAKGDVVRLVAAPYGSDQPFATSARGKVGRDSAFTFSVPAVAGDWVYRVVKPKTAIGRSANSAQFRVNVAKSPVALAVTSASPTALEAGQPVTVTGTASFNLAGQSVYLQVANGATGAWGSVASATVAPNGTFTVTGQLLQAGKSVQLRVLAPESASTAEASIAAGGVLVYGWYYLAELPMANSVRFEQGEATVAGVSYARSVYNRSDFWWNQKPWGEWNLSYSCKTFDALIGLKDASETGFQVGFRSFTDSVERYHGVKTTGNQPTRVTFDVSSAFRIRLQDEYVSGSSGSGNGYGWGVWADARVLCAF